MLTLWTGDKEPPERLRTHGSGIGGTRTFSAAATPQGGQTSMSAPSFGALPLHHHSHSLTPKHQVKTDTSVLSPTVAASNKKIVGAAAHAAVVSPSRGSGHLSARDKADPSWYAWGFHLRNNPLAEDEEDPPPK